MAQASMQATGGGHHLTPTNIARMSAIAARESGINLGPEKADFLVARLGRIVEKMSNGNFSEYCSVIENRNNTTEIRQFLEAITTHTTSFFRENGQYEWLDEAGFDILWSNRTGSKRELVVWSAACSTGQELYTAMLQARSSAKGSLASLRVKGIGTDLSRSVVASAGRAIYDTTEISGIPLHLRREYLLTSKSNPNIHRISQDIRSMTEWRVGNLTQSNTLTGIEADIVFLRNVLIYFDDETQATVLKNVLSRVRPGGFLLTGHSETARVRTMGLTVVRPTIYRKES